MNCQRCHEAEAAYVVFSDAMALIVCDACAESARPLTLSRKPGRILIARIEWPRHPLELTAGYIEPEEFVSQ